MTHRKRSVEVFTAGCPLCEDAVQLVRSVICPSCELKIYDLRKDCATHECRDKAERYGVKAVPAVAVNGELLDCCQHGALTVDALKAAGIGSMRK